MIYSGSVVYVEEKNLDRAKEILKSYDEIEVFAVSDDKTQIIIAIETEDDRTLEELCRNVKENAEIAEIAHHIFHFEDDVEEILAGRKVPSLDGFSKSSRKKEI